MITTCIDDDSVDAATMQATTDPYPSDVISLSTTLQGELRRLRYVVKKLTGWTQWYTHSEAFIFPNAAGFSSVGPHAFGGATSTLYQLGLLGTFDPSATAGAALSVGTTLTLATGEDAYGIRVAPTFTEFSSGTHALLAGLHVAPTITNAGATVTTAAGVSIATFAAGAGTTNAAGLYISAAPTAATNNYALWVDAGNVLFDANLRAESVGIGVAASGTAGRLTVNENLIVSGTGPHAIGGATSANQQVRLTGAFTGSVNTQGLMLDQTLTGVAGGNIYGQQINAQFVEAGSGVHSVIAGLIVNLPSVTNGAATTTDAASIYVEGVAAATGTTNASSIKINSAASGATNNYALWVAAGDIKVPLGGGTGIIDVQGVDTCGAGFRCLRVPN